MFCLNQTKIKICFQTKHNLHLLYVIAFDKINDVKSLRAAKSIWKCFHLLQQENIFSQKDVILMQFLLEKTNCEELNLKCIEYAREQSALCYFKGPPPGKFI